MADDPAVPAMEPPAALVDPVARALHRHYIGASDTPDRLPYAGEARIAAAALLDACDVHEQWGARITAIDGDWTDDYWRASRAQAQGTVGRHRPGRSTATATLIRRLVITTPADIAEEANRG